MFLTPAAGGQPRRCVDCPSCPTAAFLFLGDRPPPPVLQVSGTVGPGGVIPSLGCQDGIYPVPTAEVGMMSAGNFGKALAAVIPEVVPGVLQPPGEK